VASAATALVISQVAAATKIIRVGAGGIMLPNHAPLLVAEQFGTLDALYPGRIDLGLGRSSGGSEAVEKAIGRPGSRERFPQDVQELCDMLGPVKPDQPVRAIPGTGSQVPIWILGSTTSGAELAAQLGLPFAFAAHFRPDNLLTALAAYRRGFKPSPRLDRPRVIVTLSVIAAETDAEARLLATSMNEFAVGTMRDAPQRLRPPRHDVEADWTEAERGRVNLMRQRAQAGSPDTIRHGLRGLINESAADEIMVFSMIYDTEARLRSYEIVAEIMDDLQLQTANA
jgi:luciferase family oxidoreductase group 1